MKKEKLKMKNFLIISAFVLGILLLAGTLWKDMATVQAVGSNQTIVDKLVERFNLKKEDVTGVFDEVRQERQQKMQAFMEQRLNKAIDEGVITAEQKQALLNKHQEMWEKQNQLREEMQKWMEESGIDFEKLAPYHLGFGRHGFGKWHMGFK